MDARQYYEEYARPDSSVRVHAAACGTSGRIAPFELCLQIVDGLGLPADSRVLDVGCADLRLLQQMSRRFDRHGVDIAAWPSWAVESRIKARVVNCDREGLPFPDGSFDLVSALMVLEHVFDVMSLTREIHRVLKPAGWLVLQVPNLGYVKHRLALLAGRQPVTSTAADPRRHGWDGNHLHYFTRRSLDWLLRSEQLPPTQWFATGRWHRVRRRWPSLLAADLYVLAQKPAAASKANS